MVAERAGTQANFQLSVVALPAEDDEVIDEQGARVFLEPEAASLLDEKVLDASVEQDQVAFTIADQVEEKPESLVARRGHLHEPDRPLRDPPQEAADAAGRVDLGTGAIGE